MTASATAPLPSSLLADFGRGYSTGVRPGQVAGSCRVATEEIDDAGPPQMSVRRRRIAGDRIHEVKGPPITVKCDCGRVSLVPYGATWTCEDCGTRWNTSQIPAEQ